jgi:hypothetical protein
MAYVVFDWKGKRATGEIRHVIEEPKLIALQLHRCMSYAQPHTCKMTSTISKKVHITLEGTSGLTIEAFRKN